MKESSKSNVPRLHVVSAIALWLVLWTGVSIFWMRQRNNDTSNIRFGLVISLLFFNNLNILIALCEIALGKHIALIKSDFQKMKQQYAPKNEEMDAALAFLFMPLPWDRLFDGKLWSRMWSTYALYDPSYQNDESFGFFIDVGNGWSTIPPCVLMNAAIAMPQRSSPLLVGCICLASYWQILYGTIIYFLSFIWNKRWQGKKLGQVMAFVGISNGIWFFFPLAGIYACVSILDTKDFSVFGY
jgi:hypothetical protein